MFRHLLSYSCRQLFRTREVIFWTLLFPVLLATFMNMAFGKISDATEKMDTIQVALYEGKEEVALETTLQQLSQVKEGDKAFINVKKAESMEQADQWLKEGKVHGVLCQEEKLTLKVAQNGIEQSVLRQIVNQYIHYKDTLERLARENPQKLADAMEQMKSASITLALDTGATPRLIPRTEVSACNRTILSSPAKEANRQVMAKIA